MSCQTTEWGAVLRADGVARFRIWAPGEDRLDLRLGGTDHPMRRNGAGWFELELPAAAGSAYAFVLPEGAVVPDPAARAQMGDVHGPSRLTDPNGYRWRHRGWRGRPWEETVLYELHIGTFTSEGTFAAAAARLPDLAELGITAIELMPVAQFAGDRGWGYDGVLLYAPHPAYGTPDDMKALVDAAHGHGMSVLLDVVYNHFGPEGNYLPRYAPDFFHPEIHTPWGGAIAYEKTPVRQFFIDNALYWLREFHLDGLRLDAIDHIHDPADPDILTDIATRIRAEITDRPIHLTTEDARNITTLHERGEDGAVPLYTAEWNDDLHNVAHVIATAEDDGYYIDYTTDHWALMARALAEGFAFQGQHSQRLGKDRGQPCAHLPPAAFVDFLQNHDQIGNRAFGERLTTLANHDLLRSLMAVLLLSPHIPLLFMGEEYGETRPFCFFCDFHDELADLVRDGRRQEFSHFAAFASLTDLSMIPDPNALSTFEASRLDWSRRQMPEGAEAIAFMRDILALRQKHVVPHLAGTGANAGSILTCADGGIAVDWTLNGARLSLRAALSDHAPALPQAGGQAIYTLGGPFPVTFHLEKTT